MIFSSQQASKPTTNEPTPDMKNEHFEFYVSCFWHDVTTYVMQLVKMFVSISFVTPDTLQISRNLCRVTSYVIGALGTKLIGSNAKRKM